MNSNRHYRRKDFLQDILIAVLSFSALTLLLIIISYAAGLSGQLSPLVSTAIPNPDTPSYATNLKGLSVPMSIMVTSEHGRSGHLLPAADVPMAEATATLLHEALGSAAEKAPLTGEMVTEETFQKALSSPGVYVDCTVSLPVALLSTIYDVSLDIDMNARYVLVSQEKADYYLYLRNDEGTILRFGTADLSSAFQAVLSLHQPSNALFAFEAGETMAFLSPYTILTAEIPETHTLSASTTVTDHVDELLTALDFNAYTNNRYPQSNGTEIIVESPRVLRIRSDGTVIYSGDSEVTSPLYVVNQEGDPSYTESVLAVRRVLEAVLPEEQRGGTTFYCSGASSSGDTIEVTFDYLVGGIPVYFSDGSHGLTASINNGVITDFTIRCRRYEETDTAYTLLPLPQATAVAAQEPGGNLSVGYVDRGSDTITPTWLKN